MSEEGGEMGGGRGGGKGAIKEGEEYQRGEMGKSRGRG